MKFALASLLGSFALASAVPLEQRDVTEFDVTNFVAGCRGDNTGCSWSFNLVEAPSSTVLTCAGSTSSGTTFGTTSGIIACSDPAVVFVFQHIATTYRLVITDVHTPGSSIGGDKVFPPSDFTIVTDASGSHEVYTGPTSFVIPRRP